MNKSRKKITGQQKPFLLFLSLLTCLIFISASSQRLNSPADMLTVVAFVSLLLIASAAVLYIVLCFRLQSQKLENGYQYRMQLFNRFHIILPQNGPVPEGNRNKIVGSAGENKQADK